MEAENARLARRIHEVGAERRALRVELLAAGVRFSDEELRKQPLLFEVHFWLRMRTLMDRRRMESDVRRTIDRLFRDSQIVIAFPQRDVHLDAAAPLAVRVLSASDAE